MKVKKIILIVVGGIAFALGSIGVILPVLPTVPFYLVAAFCFGKSSEKLSADFKNSKLYKKNLESFVEQKGMTKRTKAKILSMVSLLMGFGFYMMENAPVGRIILFVVWICHVIYFLFFIKTLEVEY